MEILIRSAWTRVFPGTKIMEKGGAIAKLYTNTNLFPTKISQLSLRMTFYEKMDKVTMRSWSSSSLSILNDQEIPITHVL
jgi:hypothetical protein